MVEPVAPLASVVAPPLILQLCPNDHPPFRDICDVYRAAGESLGCHVLTVFFRPPYGQALPDAHYLGVPVSSSNRALVDALRQLLESVQQKPLLVICHRYRALRIFTACRQPAFGVVTIAHEFGLLARRRRRIWRRLFARRVMFAGVSPAVAQELALSVPSALCLSNAIDLPQFDQSLLPRSEARSRLGLEAGEAGAEPFTIGVVGRLINWKRPGLAVQALQRLDAGDKVQLVLLGEGPLLAPLQQQGVGLPVHLPGFHADARRLLKAFDVLLVVSESREAFGMVVLEAMAAGVPVIAGPAAGPKYVLGDNAIFYQQDDAKGIAMAIAELRVAYRDGRAATMAVAARKRVEREFSIAAVAARLDALFFKVS